MAELTVHILAERLLALLPHLAADEAAVVETHGNVVLARRQLADAEMMAWSEGRVAGANAEQRAVSLRGLTMTEILALEGAEQQHREAQSVLRVIEQEARSLRAIIPALDTRLIVTEKE
jgi:hypothetical protein